MANSVLLDATGFIMQNLHQKESELEKRKYALRAISHITQPIGKPESTALINATGIIHAKAQTLKEELLKIFPVALGLL